MYLIKNTLLLKMLTIIRAFTSYFSAVISSTEVRTQTFKFTVLYGMSQHPKAN